MPEVGPSSDDSAWKFGAGTVGDTYLFMCPKHRPNAITASHVIFLPQLPHCGGNGNWSEGMF